MHNLPHVLSKPECSIIKLVQIRKEKKKLFTDKLEGYHANNQLNVLYHLRN